MIVTQYSPWIVRGNAQAQHVLNRFFGATQGEAASPEQDPSSPRVDIREEAARFVILADLPGVDPADIEIQMDKGVLSLKGERKPDAVAEDVKSTRTERIHGRFDRRFALPDRADADSISAIGRNGVLEISIPKKPETTPRRIAING